jgi:hypothetical protein
VAAIQNSLKHATATHELSQVLEPRVLETARQLTGMLRDGDDLEVRHLLGWLHWYRSEALPEGRGRSDLAAAIGMLTPCFIMGVGQLPPSLQPVLAEKAAPVAAGLLQDNLGSSDKNLISAIVDLWQRIVEAIPPDNPDRADYSSNLGAALHTRFRQTGKLADLDAGDRGLAGGGEGPSRRPSQPG